METSTRSLDATATPPTVSPAAGEGLSHEAASDAVLVQRFNGGDASAFDEIVSRHTSKIHAVAERFLRNHADAQEITQDTFIRAHRGLARFRGDASLSTWLHRIAFNLARNRYWYFFRRCRHLTASLDRPLNADSNATLSEVVPSPEADPARQATVTEFLSLVTVCMAKMKPDQREILTLRNLLHRSYDQIALALGTNEGTVKSRIARARGSLRELIAGECPEFPESAELTDWLEPVRSPARAA